MSAPGPPEHITNITHTKAAWSTLIVISTVLAFAFTLERRVRTIAYGSDYPVLSLKQPIRSAVAFAERQRRFVRAGGSRLDFGQPCVACSADGANQLFEDLFAEQRRYVRSHYRRHAGARWVNEAEAAQTLVVAGWKALPTDSASAALERSRILDLRTTIDVLDAVWLVVIVTAFATCVAWARGYRFPRPAPLPALTLRHALFVLIWAQAFVSACSLLHAAFPGAPLDIPDILNVLPGLPLCVATIALLSVGAPPDQRTPVAAFLCVSNSNGKAPRRALTVLGLVLLGFVPLGIVLGFRFLADALALRIGVLPVWSENFSEVIAFGTPAQVALRAFNSIVPASFGEELAYRGVLFGSLVPRFGPHRAALASSLLFALIHGYSGVAFASVALGSYLRSRISEKTGTLVPAILSHSLNNALNVAWQLTLR